MLAFAANSVLCRLALAHTGIDAAGFTAIRLVAGAGVLWLLVMWRSGVRRRDPIRNGSWPSALALLAYALGFSLAYVSLPAGTGALLLFGAVQVTMIGQGLRSGESLAAGKWIGLLLACAGLVALLLPGVSKPPLGSALMMLAAGVAWGVYSLRGRSAGAPLDATAGNFLRAAPLALVIVACLHVVEPSGGRWDPAGVGYALASGGLASGIGYAIWYTVLPSLKATTAATVQLSVPVITAVTGILLLAEPLTPRLLLASIAVLGGIAMVLRGSPGMARTRVRPVRAGPPAGEPHA